MFFPFPQDDFGLWRRQEVLHMTGMSDSRRVFHPNVMRGISQLSRNKSDSMPRQRCPPSFRTSCFDASHERQHCSRYLASTSRVRTTDDAPPCDFNWVIRRNSISNRGAMRVSLRRKAKEDWWVAPLSVTLRHCCYLSAAITRSDRPRVSTPSRPLNPNCRGPPTYGTMWVTILFGEESSTNTDRTQPLETVG